MEHHQLSRDPYQPGRLVPYTGVHALDWREIMSWYPIDGVSFLVRSIVLKEPLEVRDITCSSWQHDVGWLLINVSAQHQHDEIDLGLCHGLDWREVMSWYTVDGATFMVGVITKQEPWIPDTCCRWY